MLNSIKNSRNLVLIDGNAIMYRAYYGVSKSFVPTLNGVPVGMVYGFSSILLNVIDFLNPKHLVVTFDSKEKTFRHEMDHEYKSHRKKAPDDFYPQIPFIEKIIESFGVPSFKKPGFEADDLIGSLVNLAKNKDLQTVIVSGDLDFTQLLSSKVKLLKLQGKVSESPLYGPAEVQARYGVQVDQMVDFKALTGDSSDNYSGLPGVGPKTAQKLLAKYSSLSEILKKKELIQPPKLAEKIKNNKDYLLHCQKLAAIKTDIEVDFSFESIFKLDSNKIDQFFDQMGFESLRRRLHSLSKKIEQKKELEQKSSSRKNDIKSQMSLF